MVNQTILHYKIFEKLGKGGMAAVYKTKAVKLHRIIAPKFLPRYLMSDAVMECNDANIRLLRRERIHVTISSH